MANVWVDAVNPFKLVIPVEDAEIDVQPKAAEPLVYKTWFAEPSTIGKVNVVDDVVTPAFIPV